MEFIDRETYLVAVRVWKHQYKELSEDIRRLRNEYKSKQREASAIYNGPKDWMSWANLTSKLRDEIYGADLACESAHSALQLKQQLAVRMLQIRAASKVEAHQQWLAQRART